MKKVLIIDAIGYPLVRVTKLLSSRGILGNEPLDGNEEATQFIAYYDYQPEDRDGGKSRLYPKNNTILLEDIPLEEREVKNND